MRRQRKLRPELENLEALTLLSGVHALQATGTPSVPAIVPGAALSSVLSKPPGSALPATEQQAMQADASANNLELFLSETALVASSNPAVQQFATMMIQDHTDSGLALHEVADTNHVLLPGGIQGADVLVARQVLAALNTAGFDKAYANAMVNSHQTAVAGVTAQIPAATSPEFKAFLTTVLPVFQSHLDAAKTLLATVNSGGTTGAGGTSGSVTTGSSTLSTADAQYLQKAYQAALADKYLSQLAVLVDGSFTPAGTMISQATTFQPVVAYAQKLVNDHTDDLNELGGLAYSTNTALSPGFAAADVAAVRRVLATVDLGQNGMYGAGGLQGGTMTAQGSLANTGFNSTYLQTMIQSHTQDIQNNNAAAGTLTDPSLRQFNRNDLATDYLHLNGAQTLYNAYASAYNRYPNYGNGALTGFYGNGQLNPAASFVTQLYVSLLYRYPQPWEVNYWTSLLYRHVSPQTIYRDILYSPERQMLLGRTGGYGGGYGLYGYGAYLSGMPTSLRG